MFVFMDIFPLLLLPLVVYNLIVLTGMAGAREGVEAWLAGPVFTVHSFSGDVWNVSAGDIFVFFGLMFLFIELIKSTSTDSMSLLNHGVSALAFIFYLIEFLTTRGFTNSVIFALTIMALIDVVGGYTITAIAARRDIGSSGGGGFIGR